MSKELKKWMPIFWGDYFRGTQQFTNATEHGAYLLLIAYCWNNGGQLPQGDEIRRRIAKCTPRQWNLVREQVMSKFDDEGRNERCCEELAYAIEKSKTLSANAKHRLSKSTAKADTPTPTPTPTKKERKNMAAYAAEFDEFWKSKPSRKGDNPKHPARLSYERAIKSGADPTQINAAAKRWAREALEITDMQFIPRAVTWLNQRRFEDYQPTPEDAAKTVVSDEFMKAKGFVWDGEKWAKHGEAQP